MYHSDNKFKPCTLQALLSTWAAAVPRNASMSTANMHQVETLQGFFTEVSEELCSQLHSGIMKAARRTVLEEIISQIISESVSMNEADKNPRHGTLNQHVNAYSEDSIMVMTLHLYRLSVACFVFAVGCCFYLCANFFFVSVWV